MDFDVIVIGSGFGGAITGCRLSQAGYRVVILERGRRWDKSNYPRNPDDMWLWNEHCPEKEHGWLDLRVFPHMSVAAGAAVGGGSLIYANISCEAPKEVFQNNWPQEVTYAELKPFYDGVAEVMNVQRVPANQWTNRMKLMQEAAQKAGFGDRFKQLELAVSFDPDFDLDRQNPFNVVNSKRFVNPQGVEQGTCVHLGNCDVGCDADAKNTLDRNYLALAEKSGAQIRELHMATNIQPITGGYTVSFNQLANGTVTPGSLSSRIVIVAAGSLGSTELLLRCRDEHNSLPALSPFLGSNWSSNGDFLTPAFYGTRDVSPSHGPTITCAIDFLDRSQDGCSFWIEDGGIPNLLGDFLNRLEANPVTNPEARLLLDAFRHMLRNEDPEPFRNMMPWFAQGVDAANGTLSLHHS
ncbi:MAG: GMC family oxidoreductase, partial [Acidobacteriaceae bacterium]|nr:GMC family oxidoreductase [Acidobacteriaceae bacterium]